MGNLLDCSKSSKPLNSSGLNFESFPCHDHQIRTSNPLEWIMGKIRRYSCVVSCFSGGKSALMLAAGKLDNCRGIGALWT
ncbi:MAG: hypothetical protein ACYSWZ_00820 [Planctomycetota bacterium]